MSPLIEEARRRQRRRRIALAGILLAAAALATVVALLHRGSAPATQRQATNGAIVIESVPGAASRIRLRPANQPSGKPATVLRTLVLRLGQQRASSVRVNPKTGAVTLVTTTTRR